MALDYSNRINWKLACKVKFIKHLKEVINDGNFGKGLVKEQAQFQDS